VILRTAKKNGGLATPAEVALDGNITLDDAKKHLEQLVSRGFAEVRVNKSGNLVYVFPDFSTDDVESNLEDF
jgi:predicted transcriptional regulator